MAGRGKKRQFPTAYKLKAIKRVERGEGVLPVARELGISRKILHDWIKAWKADGPDGLNRKPGPKPGPRKITVTVHSISIVGEARPRNPTERSGNLVHCHRNAKFGALPP
ncbi:helix-turn-helix domain-containing protein [Bradyrhizobium diversitatis]|uniref:helix-turn-helix domain-containing protein n=1 Tax=Bradyrhizobium diversitatis TaxID=2755406 RepID=UPI0028A25432|nr:helix-turn-helix domain-containing protein [Bradyrhizobium diversitatis]